MKLIFPKGIDRYSPTHLLVNVRNDHKVGPCGLLVGLEEFLGRDFLSGGRGVTRLIWCRYLTVTNDSLAAEPLGKGRQTSGGRGTACPTPETGGKLSLYLSGQKCKWGHVRPSPITSSTKIYSDHNRPKGTP
jgi:hypothetical protein